MLMSIASYRRNVALGVTGRYFETCFPSAFEKISPDHQLTPEIYRLYPDFLARYNTTDAVGRYYMSEEYETFFNRMAGQLGGLSCEQAVFFRPKTAVGFAARINCLLAKGYRVVLDVDAENGSHAVGLVPGTEFGFVRLRSNWVPDELRGQQFVPDLFDHLAEPEYSEMPPEVQVKDWAFNNSNVTALPPAA